jgi:hypothetical protein
VAGWNVRGWERCINGAVSGLLEGMVRVSYPSVLRQLSVVTRVSTAVPLTIWGESGGGGRWGARGIEDRGCGR